MMPEIEGVDKMMDYLYNNQITASTKEDPALLHEN